MKKNVVYGLVVALVFILLSVGSILIIYGGQKYKENDNNNNVTEEKVRFFEKELNMTFPKYHYIFKNNKDK